MPKKWVRVKKVPKNRCKWQVNTFTNNVPHFMACAGELRFSSFFPTFIDLLNYCPFEEIIEN
jgi:hypothetical protein